MDGFFFSFPSSRSLTMHAHGRIVFRRKQQKVLVLSPSELFKTAKETLGDLHIVVGNAGIIDEFQWEKCLDVNLVRQVSVLSFELAFVLASHWFPDHARKHMQKRFPGSFMSVISNNKLGFLKNVPMQPVKSSTLLLKVNAVLVCSAFT